MSLIAGTYQNLFVQIIWIKCSSNVSLTFLISLFEIIVISKHGVIQLYTIYRYMLHIHTITFS